MSDVVVGGADSVVSSLDSPFVFVSALPLAEVYDPTGAGDSFAGGLMGYLTMSEDLSFEWLNIISFSGLNDLEVHLEKLKENLILFAEAKNIETRIII